MRYAFDRFELDLDTYSLRRDGEVVQLQPKVFDVLRYLVEHRGRVVTKQELLDALWAGEHVNESAVPWSISHARKALQQQRGDKLPVETVHGRGYRFVADLEIVDEPAAPPPVRKSVRPSQPPPGDAPRGAFVGRAVVMERLTEALEGACGGRGRLCLVLGEPGIGKTRCAEELAALARGSAVAVVGGRAVDAFGAPPFWPWVQVLRELRRELPELDAEVGGVLEALQETSDDHHRPGPADVTSGRFWLLDSVQQLLHRAAAERPLLLVFDDLQWADASSMALLALLAPDLERMAMLVLGTQRDSPGAPVASEGRLSQVARHADRIPLARLQLEDVEQLARETAGHKDVAALAAAIHRATAGNPLFVQETLRSLVARHGAEALPALNPADVQMPEAARELLRSRFEVLQAPDRELLEMASVIGERFDLALLSRVAEVPLEEILERLERGCAGGLLTRDGPHAYRFPHELARSVLYDDLPVARRMALHRRVGEQLAGRKDGEPRFSEIARHFYLSLAAGGYAEVTRHGRNAAQAAMRVFAFDEAETFYGWALEAQAFDDAVQPRARAQLLLESAVAQRLAGRTQESRDSLRRTIEIASAHELHDLSVRAARQLRPTFALGAVPDPLALEALEQALRGVPDTANPTRVSGLSQLAMLPPYSLKIERSKELSGRALELARDLGRAGSLFEALRARLYSLSGAGDVDAQLALVDEILQLEKAQGRVTGVSVEAHAACYGANLLRADLDAAMRALDAMGRAAQELRMPEVLWYHDRLLTQQRFLAGEIDAALEHHERLRVQAKRIRLSYAPAFYAVQTTIARAEREGAAAVAPGLIFTQRDGIAPELASGYRAVAARYAAAAGRTDRARELLDAIAARDFEEIPRDITYLNTLANLALAAVDLDDREVGARLYELLSPYPRFNTPTAMSFYMGSVSHFLGELAAMAGDEESAETHFEHALEDNARLRFPMQLGRSRVAYGRFLLERDGAGDRARARELAQQAAEVAEALGLAPLRKAAAALLKRA